MKDINTYIEEGFYKNVGADFILHRENFEKLKSRIYNYTGGIKKELHWNDRARRIAFISSFHELPKGTNIILPLPAKDWGGKRGERIEGVFTKISEPDRDSDIRHEDWNVRVGDLYVTRDGFWVMSQISRSENFLKKEELNKIKIEFSL